MTEDRVRIYSRNGICFSDPRVTAVRSWIMNDEGEAEFDIVTNDPNCREDYLRFGNWLLVENDKLESWVGMIDQPQRWQKRYVHVHAYTPEHQLFYRAAPRQLKLAGTGGEIFTEVLRLTNRAEETIIEAGDIWTGGKEFPSENISGDHLLDYLSQLVERANAEYNFTASPANGRLTIEANWYKRSGAETQFPLEESYNLADDGNSLNLQGDIFNELWGYGNGGGQTDRPTGIYNDQESISFYGLRQGTRTYSDYTTEGAVTNALQNEINGTKQPERQYKLAALDIGTTYNQLRKGNSYPLRLWSIAWGVSTYVRVHNMHYNPFRGKVDLDVKEVYSDSNG